MTGGGGRPVSVAEDEVLRWSQVQRVIDALHAMLEGVEAECQALVDQADLVARLELVIDPALRPPALARQVQLAQAALDFQAAYRSATGQHRSGCGHAAAGGGH